MSTAAQVAPAATSPSPAAPAPAPGGPQELLKALKGNTLVPLLLAGAAVIAIVAALFLWASAPTYRVLFNNLSAEDGGRIVSELESRAIPYQFGSNGQAILVPADQVHRLRLQLAEQGLPEGGNVGFELMDQQQFGISQFSEQVNFQRSLEGELARSIESMSPVAKARVHLSMAKPSVFVRDQEPAKASVMLTLQNARSLGQSQVAAIIHLVSSSVPQLNVDNVTVVDQGGRLLSGTADGRQMSGEQLDYILEVERRFQNRIENILAPLFGADNVRVQVTADLDFTRREETLESYAPNQGENTAAVRSAQMSGNLNGANALARGIPGALSNSPPGWEASQIEAEANEDGEAATGDEQAGKESDNLRYDRIINYEVDRNLTHIEHQQGRIQRLSVAAVINYHNVPDEKGNPVAIPLSAEEMAQVERLVSQAMGFSAARNDQLEVVNRPFAAGFVSTAEEAPPWWSRPGNQALILELGRYLLAALAALLLYRALIRPLLKRYLEGAPAPKAMPLPVQAAAVGGRLHAVADDDEVEIAAPRRMRRSLSYEAELNEVRDLARDDPRMIAMVVRSWMNKDGQ